MPMSEVFCPGEGRGELVGTGSGEKPGPGELVASGAEPLVGEEPLHQ
jgi:hypothetical protein